MPICLPMLKSFIGARMKTFSCTVKKILVIHLWCLESRLEFWTFLLKNAVKKLVLDYDRFFWVKLEQGLELSFQFLFAESHVLCYNTKKLLEKKHRLQEKLKNLGWTFITQVGTSM